MAEEDAEARARKAKRKHEFETHESASSQQHTLGYISCPRCKESLHPSVKVCKGCNAHLSSSIIAPADSSSSDEPQMAHPQQKKAKRVAQMESSSSSEDGSDEEASLESSTSSEEQPPSLHPPMQEGETHDQEAVLWNRGDKRMMEIPAASNVWWYVEVVQAEGNQLRVAYPDLKNKNRVKKEWVSRSSSRLWRGSMAKSLWKYLVRTVGAGAWAPKVTAEPKKARGKKGRKVNGARSQGGTTTQCTTGGAASSDAPGEEADVMSPQKRKVHGEHDSDIEASPPWNAGPGKGERTAVTGDPLSNWFERHFTVLENQGVLDCDFAIGCPEAGWLPRPDPPSSSTPAALPALSAGAAAPSEPPQASMGADSKPSALNTDPCKPGVPGKASRTAALHGASSKALHDVPSKALHDGASKACDQGPADGGSSTPPVPAGCLSTAGVSHKRSKTSAGKGGGKSSVSKGGEPGKSGGSGASHKKKTGDGRSSAPAADAPLEAAKGHKHVSGGGKGGATQDKLGGKGRSESSLDPQPAAKPSYTQASKQRDPQNGTKEKSGSGKGKGDPSVMRSPTSPTHKKKKHPPSKPYVDAPPLSRETGPLPRILVPRADDVQPGGSIDGLMPSPRVQNPKHPLKPAPAQPASGLRALSGGSKVLKPRDGSHHSGTQGKGGPSNNMHTSSTALPVGVNGNIVKRT